MASKLASGSTALLRQATIALLVAITIASITAAAAAVPITQTA